MEPLIVYYSSESENTHRFVGRLNIKSNRIPQSPKDPFTQISKPNVLICPTFAGDDGQGTVPTQVIKFLNIEKNRDLLLGVIASGSRNFGKYYGYAGDVISNKCNVPCLFKFELMGTASDIRKVEDGVKRVWQQLHKQKLNQKLSNNQAHEKALA